MKPLLPNLFSPVRINSIELKNRAVMPAMATAYGASDSTVTERLIAYYRRRAQGGAGLVITEVCAIDPRGRGFPNEIGSWSDEFIPGLSRLAGAIHDAGARCAVQLHHAGRESFKSVLGVDPEAPSPVPSVLLAQPCEEMSRDRIGVIIQAYASAAARVREAGFDAVEVHGAHGYLIGQFLSPFSNKREDRYGGSDENRARFALEIVEAVRSRVGDDFPLIVRFSAEELVRGGYGLEFAKWLAPSLVKAGADALHVSVGVYSTPGNLSIASMDTPPGFNLHRARAIKGTAGVPVIGVGRVHDPRLADEAIARGDADLISFGRQHIADPDFLAKASRGDFDDVRWCLACNQGCIDRISFEMKSSSCSINPECGRELTWESLKMSERPKRLWIIGAGPAGLSAALAASQKGHHIEIYERDDQAGGQLRSASRPPHKEGFAQWVNWALRQLKKNGITPRYKIEVDERMLRAEKPDAVILATGALPLIPDISGMDAAQVVDARDVLLEKVTLSSPAVVLGAGFVGMETSDFLLDRGIQVTLLEMSETPPVSKMTAHGYWLNKRLKEGGGRLILGARVVRIEPGAVLYAIHGREEKIDGVMLIINALGTRSETGLASVCESLNIPCIKAGDSVSPRRLFEAVHEGARAGLEM